MALLPRHGILCAIQYGHRIGNINNGIACDSRFIHVIIGEFVAGRRPECTLADPELIPVNPAGAIRDIRIGGTFNCIFLSVDTHKQIILHCICSIESQIGYVGILCIFGP